VRLAEVTALRNTDVTRIDPSMPPQERREGGDPSQDDTPGRVEDRNVLFFTCVRECISLL
jgi:hypothetical protein